MENRIKEEQLAVFANRITEEILQANQLRLYFASFAYMLLEILRRLACRARNWRGRNVARCV